MNREYKKGRGLSEKILSTPLLPENSVKTVLISGEYPEFINRLKDNYGIEALIVNKNPELDIAISSHADCCFLQLDKYNLFIDDNNYDHIVNFLTSKGLGIKQEFKITTERVFSPYPSDVPLNAKVIGNRVLCNAKYLSESVKRTISSCGFELINVKQGYAACSTVVINYNALITDDESIYASSKSNGIDCILISKGSVELKGYNYGFIGGTCGMIDKNLIAFTGSINHHTDAELIVNFLNKYNVRYIELTDGPLVDIGGIIPLTELI